MELVFLTGKKEILQICQKLNEEFSQNYIKEDNNIKDTVPVKKIPWEHCRRKKFIFIWIQFSRNYQ